LRADAFARKVGKGARCRLLKPDPHAVPTLPDGLEQASFEEVVMSIIRLIHIRIDPSEMKKALEIWKQECAPLMIQQKGCISEKLLQCRDAPELISYSEWDSEADIELYRASDAHKEIVRHARGLKGAEAVVKLYDLVK
jgi:heme-degrading monooxygenase HmoA